MASTATLSVQRLLARLGRNNAGVSAIEFGLILPILTVMGMYGTEIANMSTVNMQVSQLAISVADNASRLGQTDNSSVTPTITEADVNSIMVGAVKQGAGFGFQANGKVILSSLEKQPVTNKQYIHWQRCVGALVKTSAYGNQGSLNGLTGTALLGMGTGSGAVAAPSTSVSVMYVEVFFKYKPVFGNMFVDNIVMKQEAAFLTRDDRNLTSGVTGTGSTSNCT